MLEIVRLLFCQSGVHSLLHLSHPSQSMVFATDSCFHFIDVSQEFLLLLLISVSLIIGVCYNSS